MVSEGAFDDVADAVAADGPIPFDRFMEIALYGPHGFYIGGGRAGGRRGDFITSPEVGPLFGDVLARALDGWWRELGEPAEFTVVDAGAGPGTLARSILAAKPDCAEALRLITVEVSGEQRAGHPAAVTALAQLPIGPITGVVVANELLDNLPFRLAVFDGEWREAFVTVDRGRCLEVLGPSTVLPQLPARAPHGARVPVQDAAGRWVADALGRLERGRLVVIDYAAPITAELAIRPWREWLRTYRGHQRGGHYLADPGLHDITTEVAVDQLVAAAGEPTTVRSQAQFLQLWGIGELVEEGKSVWAEQATRPGLEAMKMRSRISEAEALLDPAGLGAFTVLEWTAG